MHAQKHYTHTFHKQLHTRARMRVLNKHLAHKFHKDLNIAPIYFSRTYLTQTFHTNTNIRT
jgi:hypothetical protein